MNNYSAYDPEFCDGHYCCRDCDNCPWADEAMEYILEVEGEADD